MSPVALALVLVAALLHAGWNLFLKQVEEKYIVTWWSTLSSAVLLSPLVFAAGFPPPVAWPYLLASAAVEALYIAALINAYNLSDFSLVYPIARGAAPAFIALWAVLLLGERISLLGGLGLALVIGGLVIVGSSGLVRRDGIPESRTGQPSRKLGGVLLALLVSVLISAYSTIDAAAVKLTPATPYTIVMLFLMGLFITPFAVKSSGWRCILDTGRRYWLSILLIGGAGMVAYILVLNAYAIGRVSYAGAVREVSVVFGALAGWKLLGEGLGPWRVLGAILIFVGIVLIAVGG